MNWIIKLVIDNWSWFAIICSLIWGFYGCGEEIRDEEKEYKEGVEKRECWHRCIWLIGIFLSEFIGSFIGWICLYVLVFHYNTKPLTLGSFDVFLGIVAVLGITGYAYRLADAIGKKADAICEVDDKTTKTESKK